MRIREKRKGFSIVELLVVMALIALISGVFVVSLVGRKSRRTLDTATTQLAATLREAGSRATAGTLGTAWGVHLDNTTTTTAFYALFSSSTYSAAFEVGRTRLPPGVFFTTSSVPVGQAKDVIFAQMTGMTTATSVGLMMLSSDSTSTLITIASSGMVSF